MKNKIFLIISREYSIRVKKKAFIFTTIFMPIVLLALMFGPVLLQNLNDDKPSAIALVDESGAVAETLMTGSSLPYTLIEAPIDSVKSNVDYTYILCLGKDIVDNPSDAKIYVHGNSSMEVETAIADDLKQALEKIRLNRTGHGYVTDLIKQAEASVNLDTIKINDEGVEEKSDTMLSLLIGIVMAFILYMFIIIYGQLVMMGIIEEKNSRVLELIVTSVKPTQLMIGKIIGIGLVAVTQVLIWGALIAVFIQFILPAFTGPELMEQVAALRNGEVFEPTYSVQLLQTMAILTSLGYVFSIFGYLVLFLAGGFLLYSSMYAIVGASVDNPQDGSQLQTFILVPVILSLVFATNVGSNPDSELAQILSLIPFTSPMIMMARIPAGVPFGQIALSLVILFASVALLIWFAAKIYRVGIFMYGKKPTIGEIIKWARYK